MNSHDAYSSLGRSDRAYFNRMRQHRSLEGDLHFFRAHINGNINSNTATTSVCPSYTANYSNMPSQPACYADPLGHQSLPPADPQTRQSVNQVPNLSYSAFRDLSPRRSDPVSSSLAFADYSSPYKSAFGATGIDYQNITHGHGNMQPLSITTSNPIGLLHPMTSLGGGMTGVTQDPLSSFPSASGLSSAYGNYLSSRDTYSMSLPALQREFDALKREYDSCSQKLASCMHSIKTFWSPELKKERAARKEEAQKLVLVQEQMKLMSMEHQKQSAQIRQLQTEVQCQYELSKTIRDTEVHSIPKEEYDALRLEKDRISRELALFKDTVREFELQTETQRQTLNSRDDSIKKLLDLLQNKGILTFAQAHDRMELEQCRSRIIELENRYRYTENLMLQKEQDIIMLREECANTSHKMKQMCMQYDGLQRIPGDEREVDVFKALLDSKSLRVDQLEQRLTLYEEEILKLRDERSAMPRNFTDKSVSDIEYREMKLKMEKLQLELGQKQNETATLQVKCNNNEEHLVEAKKQLELLRDTLSSKDVEISQMQADIGVLRQKLETRTDTIEQKSQQLQSLHQEKNHVLSEILDLQEQLKIKDTKLISLQRKVDNSDEIIKDKDHQIDLIKQRLAASPSMVQQKQFQEQLEEVIKERDNLLHQIREQSDRIEAERFEELDHHRTEVRNLRSCIESLQKELSDRQMLIESQNEKISDLNRDLVTLRLECKRLSERSQMGEGGYYLKEAERLNRELVEARNEIDRLLKIVQNFEKEKERIQSEIKAFERQSVTPSPKIQPTMSSYSTTSLERRKARETLIDFRGSAPDIQTILSQREQRVEELEEALKESVSITAERELAVAQQKQMTQHLEQKMGQYKDQLNRVQRQYDEMNKKFTNLSMERHDKDALLSSIKLERRKHLEEVLQLKEEALLAAISEKDAHIALLEASGQKNAKTSDELVTLRKHKDKLMRKLKEENARRIKLMNELQTDTLADYYASYDSEDPGSSLPNDQDDDAEGIWA